MVYVLSGSVQLERKNQTYTLGTRDVLYISGETPRNYRSAGETPARVLIISFDSETADPPRPRRRALTSAA
jgi:quercetin dioxygenase-like cupin family protein